MTEPSTYDCAPIAPRLPNRCIWTHHHEDVDIRCGERPMHGGVECLPHFIRRLEAHLLALYRAALSERTEA